VNRHHLTTCLIALLFTSFVTAQPHALTIAQAVDLAVRNYPSVRVSQEQLNAAAAAIRVARTAYLPRVDGIAQANRATRNNVFGMLLPQSVIPPISGPVLGTNNFGTAWGSAAGILVSWEPFDFGLRRAGVEAAEAARSRSEAALSRTRYEVAIAAAGAVLTVAAAEETARAAQAGIDRAGVLVRVVSALVKAELRPGADESRVRAELAAAQTQGIQAQQAIAVARATLAQFTGLDPGQIALDTARLRDLPAETPSGAASISNNPIAREQNAAVDEARAELKILDRSYYPRFLLEGAAYSRGSGAQTDGRILGGWNGLAPNVQNYGLGLTVSLPFLNIASIRAREAVQSANTRAEEARYQQVTTDLTARWNAARATLDAARRIAENTPVEVSAARAAVQQATARYQSGLGNIVEVADAQRLLTQAEIDDAIARLNVWRALLELQAAQGDIQPFLNAASLQNPDHQGGVKP
jgi:outer membrane protein TolC